MKSIKTVAIGLSIMLLSSCGQTADNLEIKAGEAYCKSQNSSLQKIDKTFDGKTFVKCTNGKFDYLTEHLIQYKNKLIANTDKEGQDEIKNH